MNRFFAGLFLVLCSIQLAFAAGGMFGDKLFNANPSVSLKVYPSADPKMYVVLVKIVDLNTGAVIAEPRMLAELGESASLRIGTTDNQSSFKVVVTVDEAQKELTYSSEFVKAGKVASLNSATFSIAR